LAIAPSPLLKYPQKNQRNAYATDYPHEAHSLNALSMIIFALMRIEWTDHRIPKKPRSRTLNESWHIGCEFSGKLSLKGSFSGAFAPEGR
jgi:hypothetical protein